MPGLLSGATLIAGAEDSYITLATAQPQLPATPTTTTGYTIITDVVYPSQLVSKYASSLGNIEFTTGTMQANLQDLNINIVGNGTGTVVISGLSDNTNTDTGVLVIKGGIGISDGLHSGKDIVVNKLSIGQGYSNLSGGVNNIVITGSALPTLNDFPVGQESIVIGYDALKNIDTSYKVIAIGRNAAGTGKFLENIIAIGDNALHNIGSTQTEFACTITGVVSPNPLTLQVSSTATLLTILLTGYEILIKDVIGMVELNDQTYYIDVINATDIVLYDDINLQNAVDASTYNGYISGGNIYKTLLWNGNFAIGNNAGKELINGEQNFFLGYNPAVNFTTGSYNFFMGHEIAGNMISGNSNISIGGDNMVDGLDDQINIGSVFYYNGSGYLELNSDTGLGLGTDSTSTTSGAFNVDGGAGITGNLYVGGILNVVNPTQATTTTDGALVVAGGVGIGGDLWVGGTLHATALASLVSGSSDRADEVKANPTASDTYLLAMTSQQTGYTSIYSPGSITYDGFNDVLYVASYLRVDNTDASSNTGSGALVVQGGVGIGENLNVQNNIITYHGDIGLGSAIGSTSVTSNSISFNGSTDYLTIADNAALQLGTSVFTIETWFYKTYSTTNSQLAGKGSSGAGWRLFLLNNGSGNIYNITFTNVFNTVEAIGLTILPNTWNHVAVVREGLAFFQTKLYLNGVLSASGTCGSNLNQTADLRIGSGFTDVAPYTNHPGRISNFRIVKGAAVYTANFTPTLPLTAISGTALLLNVSSSLTYLNDSSGNNFTATPTGSPAFVASGPTATSSGPLITYSFALHVNQSSGNLEFHPNTYDTNIGPSSAILSLANDGSASTTINPLTINTTTVATSTVTGALKVVGGVGVQGSVYSRDGNPLQNYLLYTPKVTITDTGLPPPNPKPGDFWIDTQILAELQYVQDGANAFWIQITSL